MEVPQNVKLGLEASFELASLDFQPLALCVVLGHGLLHQVHLDLPHLHLVDLLPALRSA